MTTRLLFKVLNEDGSCHHGGKGRWLPGEVKRVKGPLVPCKNGLHLCEPQDLVQWLGPAIWTVQIPDGVEEIRDTNKLVVRTARLEQRVTTWNDRTARLFACDCAERVAHLNPDPRIMAAITIARRFAHGEASANDLAAAWAAARAAAWAAARAAAGDAAGDAAAWAARAAAGAARAAVWAAAEAAAWAAGAAERDWQTARLMDYLCGRVA